MKITIVQKVFLDELNVQIEHLIVDQNKAIAIDINGEKYEIDDNFMSKITLAENNFKNEILAQETATVSSKAALLEKLGITEEEAKLLLS